MLEVAADSARSGNAGAPGRLSFSAKRREDPSHRSLEVAMQFYMTTFSVTPEVWAGLIQSPEDRRHPVSAAAESVGGKLHGY